MKPVDYRIMRKTIITLVQANRHKLVSVDVAGDESIFAFEGKHYVCEIQIDGNWFGYDLQVEDAAGCDFVDYVDARRMNDKRRTKEELRVYEEMLNTVRKLLNGDIYYLANPNCSYVATKNNDGTFDVSYWELKMFLFYPYSSGWSNRTFSKDEFDKLHLKVLD
ncbi:hypothetical protein JNJ66_03540 [Candidatus Saccharibacteria bacterium]|nr:hypothetical protein [Candidatus Saccharibacteria bacterium]